MKIVRYLDSSKQVQTGWVNDDLVGLIRGSIFGEFHREEATTPLAGYNCSRR